MSNGMSVKGIVILTIEENVSSGGFGSNVTLLLAARGFKRINIDSMTLPDIYINYAVT